MGAWLVGAFLGVANAAESAKTKFRTTLKAANQTPPGTTFIYFEHLAALPEYVVAETAESHRV